MQYSPVPLLVKLWWFSSVYETTSVFCAGYQLPLEQIEKGIDKTTK